MNSESPVNIRTVNIKSSEIPSLSKVKYSSMHMQTGTKKANKETIFENKR